MQTRVPAEGDAESRNPGLYAPHQRIISRSDTETRALRKRILIVSPALARANNGNWQTASRWARFLRGAYEVEVTDAWQSKDPAPDLLIALHARRCAS